MLVKSFAVETFLERYDVLGKKLRILNAGSYETRYGESCVNVDIQAGKEVDVVCDLHDLPQSIGQFDVVLCNAVLQYCHSPELVARNLLNVLKPDGLLFVDVPWVQPYCPHTPDRFRYSEEALRTIFQEFEVIEAGPSITSGSAFYMQGVMIASHATHNRYVNYALRNAVGFILYPWRHVRTTKEAWTAGGIYLIGRKRA